MRALLLVPAALLVAACGSSPALVSSKPVHAVVIRNVAVLDVESGARSEPRDVLVRAGRITDIGAPGSVSPPAGAESIDGTGATLLPGLVDMHTHTGNPMAPAWEHALPDPKRTAQAFLYAGVTTVLDTGGLDDDAIRRRDRIAKGEILGPRMFAAGPVITARNGHPVPMLRTLPWWQRALAIPKQTRQIESARDARVTVEEIAGFGADVVKVAVDRLPDERVPRLETPLIEEVVKQAARHKLRVVAHIGTTQDALDTGRAGVAAWVHGVYRERIPDEAIPELAKLGIPMVPTLVVFDHYATLLSPPYRATDLEREVAGAETLAKLDHPPTEGESVDRFRPFFELLAREREDAKDNVRRLHAAGVTILAGSDSHTSVLPGASLHRELGLLVEAGLTPAEAIRAATLDPARFLTRKPAPEFGRIAVGAAADLLLVEGDPTADIRNVSKIRAVLKNGRRLERKPAT